MSADAPERPPLFPWPFRWGLPLAACALACGLSEGMMRVVDGNSFPQLDIFEARDGQLRLRADASAKVRRADGGTYVVHTGAEGLRLPVGEGWLIVGDSQVLGYGVHDDQSFPALLGAINAGVPGHGVADAIQHADELVPGLHPTGVIVVLNQANDWDEGMVPALDRYVVRGGWLGGAGPTDPRGAAFWSSRLSHLHLLAYPALAFFRRSPPPPGVPDLALAATFRGCFDAFAARWPALRVVAAYLPADSATSEARAAVSPLTLPGEPWKDRSVHDATEAAFAGAELIDLQPALSDPESFQPGDYHLSAQGHVAVAGMLRASLGGGMRGAR